MSRIGKLPVKVPKGVKVNITKNVVNLEGPKGKISHTLPSVLNLEYKNDEIKVKVVKETETSDALFGLNRTIVHNMVHGVTEGFTKTLEINGVGFKAAVKGKQLQLSVGFSHTVDFDIPNGITIKVEQNKVLVTGADKILVGETAAKIRGIREPEPYQGKGIKYSDEVIIRKSGKAAAGGAGAGGGK